MKCELLSIGKIRTGPFAALQQEYLQRIGRYTDVSLKDVKGLSQTRSASDAIIREKESALLKNKISSESFVIALDRQGRELTSRQFAEKISSLADQGRKKIVFVIGGATGLSADLLHSADLVLSMSRLTFQHDMAKIILLEQMYRAFTIIKGEKYHK